MPTFSCDPILTARVVRIRCHNVKPLPGEPLVYVWRAYKFAAKCWAYRDHDGYDRVVEGTWLDLADALSRKASDYGLRAVIS